MEEKPNKLKLTLNKSVNIADITTRLNMLAGKSNVLDKNQASKSQSSAHHNAKGITNQSQHNKLPDNKNTFIKKQVGNSKAEGETVIDQQTKKQQITKTNINSNAADSVQTKQQNVEKVVKDSNSKTYNAGKGKDKTAVKNQAKNEVNTEKQQPQQDKQNTYNKKKKNDKHHIGENHANKEHVSKKQEANKTISFKGVLSRLKQLYPVTFPPDETKIVALKVGINKEIKDNVELIKKLNISITYLGKFLKWYTSSKNYRTLTQIEGNARYDLQGNIEGVVTKEQAEDIKKRLEHTASSNLASVSENNKEIKPIKSSSGRTPKSDSDN